MSTDDIDDLVRNADRIRMRLAGNVDRLADLAHPKAIAARSLDGVKAKFLDGDGFPRLERFMSVAVAAVATLFAIAVMRRLTRRR